MTTLKTTLRTTTIALSMAFWILVAGGLLVYAVKTLLLGGGKVKEVQVLTQAVSPDGFLEARVLRIVGAPGSPGATVWQEVELARKGTPVRFLKAQDDPGFVCSAMDDAPVPVVRLRWLSPTRLVLAPSHAEPAPLRRWTVLGVQIEEAMEPLSNP